MAFETIGEYEEMMVAKRSPTHKAVDFLKEAVYEMNRARAKYPAGFHSFHEGFAVLLEEFDELKAEVWKSSADKKAMKAELTQIAAMCLRFNEELL